ncbi:conjugal transfer protein TraB [Haloprofundus marisrubri]|uniref:Conjugal transfer protein TraB n=1 Tax=Haloprofundus marisrubri TaxID=1514971 RepID=A0A0W1RDG3_9EURY|nr:TraB/GumN family protein [Haloprofundus marisrubri]KTG11163.1 conjugal transfer protein TraB [Haloprofundus marisrubri]
MSNRAESAPETGHVRVVGTAHVSADSVREVEETIEAERPDVVAVELDEGRYRQMQGETPDDLDPSELLQGNTVFQFIAYWMLSYVQAQMGDKFDVKPGADMLAAVETAQEHGIDVALVDRDIQTTIQRFWARMGFIEKLRMAGGLVFGVTDARIVGLMLGLLVGFVAGPIIAVLGGFLGLTEAVFVRALGSALLGVGSGIAISWLASLVVDDGDSIVAGLAGGLALALLGGATLGLTDPFVQSTFSGFMTQVGGSLALGMTGGVVVGLLGGVLMAATGMDRGEDIDELDMAELTDTDVVSVMMEEFREFSPGGAEALIDERDAYLAHNIVSLRNQGKDVIAVVGAGHKQGIENYLRNPETLPPMESLTGVAEKRGIPWAKIIGTLVSVGFVAFFLLLAMAGVRDGFLLRLFGAWFLVNGIFAAGLAKLAGARWSSATVGGLVAWMTSVNPLLAPGWFTGYMELRHTAVNVADIGRLNELLTDEETPLGELMGQMFDVPLFRLIMVVAMTNIGSIIASLLFVTYILPLFGAELGGAEAVTRLMVDGARNSAELIWGALT